MRAHAIAHRPAAAFALCAIVAVLAAPATRAAGGKPGADAPAVIAGVFTTGEGGIRGAGETLSFPAAGRFRLAFGTCVKPDDVTTGRAVVRGGQVALLIRRGGPDLLTPVTWGPRQYLVRDLLQFVNDVNAGVEPRADPWGAAFLRVDDWKKPVGGQPPLPPPWADRLLASPIATTLAEVALPPGPPAADPKATRATLPVGSDHGIFVGMVLWTDRPSSGSPIALTVVSTDKDRSVVETRDGPLAAGRIARSRRSKQ